MIVKNGLYTVDLRNDKREYAVPDLNWNSVYFRTPFSGIIQHGSIEYLLISRKSYKSFIKTDSAVELEFLNKHSEFDEHITFIIRLDDDSYYLVLGSAVCDEVTYNKYYSNSDISEFTGYQKYKKVSTSVYCKKCDYCGVQKAFIKENSKPTIKHFINSLLHFRFKVVKDLLVDIKRKKVAHEVLDSLVMLNDKDMLSEIIFVVEDSKEKSLPFDIENSHWLYGSRV